MSVRPVRVLAPRSGLPPLHGGSVDASGTTACLVRCGLAGGRCRGRMRLLLIRYGQTPSSVAGLLDTRIPGPGLTDLGRRQAEALPALLAEEGIGALLVSTMRRTHESAAPLAAALPLDNTGVVVLEGSGTRWTLVSWQGEPVSGVGAMAPSGPTGDITS